MGILIVAKSAY